MALAGNEVAQAIDSQMWHAWRDGERVNSEALKVGSNSIDLSLDRRLLVCAPNRSAERLKRDGCLLEPERAEVDLHDASSVQCGEVEIPAWGFVLRPGVLYLGASRECFDCDAPWKGSLFVQRIEGRSTCARVGLSVHASAGFGDWGFKSCWVVELQVVYPTRVYCGDRLAQVFFVPVECGPSGMPEAYSGAYQEQQNGPRAAELGKARFA